MARWVGDFHEHAVGKLVLCQGALQSAQKRGSIRVNVDFLVTVDNRACKERYGTGRIRRQDQAIRAEQFRIIEHNTVVVALPVWWDNVLSSEGIDRLPAGPRIPFLDETSRCRIPGHGAHQQWDQRTNHKHARTSDASGCYRLLWLTNRAEVKHNAIFGRLATGLRCQDDVPIWLESPQPYACIGLGRVEQLIGKRLRVARGNLLIEVGRRWTCRVGK